MTFTITQEHSVPALPARVFEALTNPRQLSCWFAEHAEVTPQTEGSYRFWGRHTLGTPSAEEARQAITQFHPDDALGYAWNIHGVPTHVQLRVRPGDAGTLLTLEHQVCAELMVPRARELIDDHWRLALANLSAYLLGGEGLRLPDYAESAPAIQHQVRIDAPPSVVFRALIDPARVNRWLGSTTAVIEPRVGGRYHLGWQYKVDDRDVVGGPRTILEIVPDQRLTLDWPDWRGDPAVPDQVISFELLPNGLGGTSLTFTHDGFVRVTDMSDFGLGWLGFLDGLRKEVMH